jgi:hypothetical protein
MTNPYLERRERVKTGHGLKSEKRVIKKLGGKQHAGSGACAGLKSDGSVSAKMEMRVECKSTIHDSISVKKEVLDKIMREALNGNQYPMLTISFVDAEGRAKPGGTWALIPDYVMQELLGK